MNINDNINNQSIKIKNSNKHELLTHILTLTISETIIHAIILISDIMIY